jgi:hypothetical protein
MPPAPEKKLRWGRVIFALVVLVGIAVGAIMLITR